MANKALHLTAIPLRFIAAGELGHSPRRYAPGECGCDLSRFRGVEARGMSKYGFEPTDQRLKRAQEGRELYARISPIVQDILRDFGAARQMKEIKVNARHPDEHGYGRGWLGNEGLVGSWSLEHLETILVLWFTTHAGWHIQWVETDSRGGPRAVGQADRQALIRAIETHTGIQVWL